MAFENLRRYTLAAGGIDSSTTSVSLTSVASPPGVPFRALIKNVKYPDAVDDPEAEIVEVTVAGASPWTVTRGEETSAFTHQNGTYHLIPIFSAFHANMLQHNTAGDKWVEFEGDALTFIAGLSETLDQFKVVQGDDMGDQTILVYDTASSTWDIYADNIRFRNEAGGGVANLQLGTTGPQSLTGSVDPSSTGVVATVGSYYTRVSGGVGSLYHKEGSGDTDWGLVTTT